MPVITIDVPEELFEKLEARQLEFKRVVKEKVFTQSAVDELLHKLEEASEQKDLLPFMINGLCLTMDKYAELPVPEKVNRSTTVLHLLRVALAAPVTGRIYRREEVYKLIKDFKPAHSKK